jgi:hypothetical protein
MITMFVLLFRVSAFSRRAGGRDLSRQRFQDITGRSIARLPGL